MLVLCNVWETKTLLKQLLGVYHDFRLRMSCFIKIISHGDSCLKVIRILRFLEKVYLFFKALNFILKNCSLKVLLNLSGSFCLDLKVLLVRLNGLVQEVAVHVGIAILFMLTLLITLVLHCVYIGFCSNVEVYCLCVVAEHKDCQHPDKSLCAHYNIILYKINDPH